MCNLTRIEPLCGYMLTPCMDGLPKKLCFVSGRQGNAITVLLVTGISVAEVKMFDREYAKVATCDGYYNLMPCNRVTDVNEVAIVCDIIRNCPE